MRIDIMTLFPEAVSASLDISILGRAEKKGILDIRCHQIRDYTDNKQQQVDDYPYGGGWGCVMMAQPLKACLDDIIAHSDTERRAVLYMSPQGTPFTQTVAKRLVADYDQLVLVCGHYEGIDERFIEACVDEEISLGDFVLTGGEIAAMAVTDAVCRMVPGVLSDEECFTGESHWDGLLEYPQYTRPEIWEGRAVPEILRSGKQREIDLWRRRKMLERTMDKRPDLWKQYKPEGEDAALAQEIENQRHPKPVFDYRRATEEDLPAVNAICEAAKEYLKSHNLDQWQAGYPNEESFRSDMAVGGGWVFTEHEEIAGYVAILHSPEENYREIFDGTWLTEGENYASVHRIMVAPQWRGSSLSKEMMALAEDLAYGWGCESVKVDTHKGNGAMQQLCYDCGYRRCGIVPILRTAEAGSLRIAYEKVLV